VRFETPPGEQAQVDLARFEVAFTDEPGVTRIIWLFSMVLKQVAETDCMAGVRGLELRYPGANHVFEMLR
jgi:hypothetical protein